MTNTQKTFKASIVAIVIIAVAYLAIVAGTWVIAQAAGFTTSFNLEGIMIGRFDITTEAIIATVCTLLAPIACRFATELDSSEANA